MEPFFKMELGSRPCCFCRGPISRGLLLIFVSCHKWNACLVMWHTLIFQLARPVLLEPFYLFSNWFSKYSWEVGWGDRGRGHLCVTIGQYEIRNCGFWYCFVYAVIFSIDLHTLDSFRVLLPALSYLFFFPFWRSPCNTNWLKKLSVNWKKLYVNRIIHCAFFAFFYPCLKYFFVLYEIIMSNLLNYSYYVLYALSLQNETRCQTLWLRTTMLSQ